jgi:hypothetical protein
MGRYKDMRKINIGSLMLSVIGLFGALLYFVGRRYIEQYYAVLSVPLEITDLSYADYVYYGVQPLQVIVPALFTLIGIRFLLIIFQSQKEQILEIEKSNQVPIQRKHRKIKAIFKTMKAELRIVWNGVKNRYTLLRWQEKLIFFYLIYLFAAIGYSLIWIVGLQQLNPAANMNDLLINTYVSLLMVLIFVCFGIFFFFDRSFSTLIQNHKKVKRIFLVCGIISLCLFPYIEVVPKNWTGC